MISFVFFETYWVAILCIGDSVKELGLLVVHLSLAWCILLLLLSFPFSWPIVWLCLQVIYLNQCCCHWLFLTQSPHLWEKKQSMYLWRILAVSCGYFARLIWACTVLYHSSTLFCPCLKLVNRSNLALTSFVCSFQNSSNLFHMTSKYNFSGGKYQDTYWSIPKSPDQAIVFLHFLVSANIASLHSNMILHFNFHFRNMLYKLSLTVQSIFGPSI